MLEAGVSLAEFWDSTMRELQLVIRARTRRRNLDLLFLAWHTAALSRVAKFPSLADLMGESKTPEQVEAELTEKELDYIEIAAAHERAKAKRSD